MEGMTKRISKLFGPVVVLVFAGLGISTLGQDDALAAPLRDSAPSIYGEEECIDCSVCVKNGQAGHKAPEGDSTSVHDRGLGSHTGCITTGGCSEQHPINEDCVDHGEELASVIADVTEAIDAGTPEVALRLAREHKRFVVHVAERNSIQGIGCRGQVVANIPLN